MKTIAIAGYSGSGKTTLIEKVIPQLIAAGYRVSLIKHAHHEFDVDMPGKDSHRHRMAGAMEVMVTSSNRWALMHELRGAKEPTLEEQLKHLSPCDVVIVEGWKHYAMPKIEVHRKLADKPLLFLEDKHVVAIATDEKLAANLPQFGLEDAEGLARFIIDFLGLKKISLIPLMPVKLVK
jgi:molybdopterin-guanine dinucleotide biosynthesis adapter protein